MVFLKFTKQERTRSPPKFGYQIKWLSLGSFSISKSTYDEQSFSYSSSNPKIKRMQEKKRESF